MSSDATISPSMLDDYLEKTVRCDAVHVPPEALRVDDDGPTLAVSPGALAALASASVPSPRPVPKPAVTTSLFTARRLRRPIATKPEPDDDAAMRNAVIGIWTVAAILFAMLGILVR